MEHATGDMIVNSTYTITPKGGLLLDLKEHILLPTVVPLDVEGLIMSIQKSVPFDFFDPSETTLQTTVRIIFILFAVAQTKKND